MSKITLENNMHRTVIAVLGDENDKESKEIQSVNLSLMFRIMYASDSMTISLEELSIKQNIS